LDLGIDLISYYDIFNSNNSAISDGHDKLYKKQQRHQVKVRHHEQQRPRLQQPGGESIEHQKAKRKLPQIHQCQHRQYKRGRA